MSVLFEDFLENEETYTACEKFWRDLITEIETSLGPSAEWTSWIPKTYADNVTRMERDGNPIVDGFSRDLDRAFRVVQEEPDPRGVHRVRAYLTHSDDSIYEGADFPTDDLTIILTLTDESAQIARRLLKMWMNPAYSVGDMELEVSQL